MADAITIDPIFEARVTELLEIISHNAVENNQRKWVEFIGDGDVDIFDPDTIKNLFDRDTATREIARIAGDKDTQHSEIVFHRVAIEFLSEIERMYRAKHRTRLRNFAHRSSSGAVLGSEAGAIFQSTLSYVSKLASAGNTDEN